MIYDVDDDADADAASASMWLPNVRLQIGHILRPICAPIAAQLERQARLQLAVGRPPHGAGGAQLRVNGGHRPEMRGGEAVPVAARSQRRAAVQVGGDDVQMEALHAGRRMVAEQEVAGRQAGQFDGVAGEQLDFGEETGVVGAEL